MSSNIASSSGVIGAVSPDARSLTADFDLNTQVVGSQAGDGTQDGYVWRYVQANGAIVASQTDVAVTAAGQASDGLGTYVNTVAFADNEYGWVRNVTILADAAA